MNTHVETVCRRGQGAACCRYLGMGPEGWACFKLNPALRAHLDIRVLTGSMVATSDNCDGRADLAELGGIDT